MATRTSASTTTSLSRIRRRSRIPPPGSRSSSSTRAVRPPPACRSRTHADRCRRIRTAQLYRRSPQGRCTRVGTRRRSDRPHLRRTANTATATGANVAPDGDDSHTAMVRVSACTGSRPIGAEPHRSDQNPGPAAWTAAGFTGTLATWSGGTNSVVVRQNRPAFTCVPLVLDHDGRSDDYAPTPRGQALAEFALVVPIFLVFVFAIIDFGRYVYTANTLSNSAREAARIGSVGARPTECSGLSRQACVERIARDRSWGLPGPSRRPSYGARVPQRRDERGGHRDLSIGDLLRVRPQTPSLSSRPSPGRSSAASSSPARPCDRQPMRRTNVARATPLQGPHGDRSSSSSRGG